MSLVTRIHKRAAKSLDWLRGWLRARVALPFLILTKRPIRDVSRFARRVSFIESPAYAQNGEDGMLEAIFAKIGVTNRYCVEFGAYDGRTMSNTWYLRERKGWNGLLMDSQENPSGSGVHKEFVTAENIEELFKKYGVPGEFDLLSIDIDGNDYWVWRAIRNETPRVVVIEYNACFPAEESKVIPYRPDFAWDKTDYCGATLKAMEKLGKTKGYALVATDRNGVNAFFVRDDLVPGNFSLPPFGEIYHPAAFKGKKGNKHPPDQRGRPWMQVSEGSSG